MENVDEKHPRVGGKKKWYSSILQYHLNQAEMKR